MRVPEFFLTSVCFLCVENPVGSAEKYKYGGTAFFVSVPSDVLPECGHVYVVTARHNVIKSAEEGGPLYLRINTEDGGSEFFKIKSDWEYPEDDAVDLAVLPWDIRPDTHFVVGLIPLDMVVQRETIAQRDIGIGDDLLIAGLFTQRQGSTRNIPVVRQGIIAAMPEEPLEDTNTGLLYDAYLAEVRSIGGLSGSPVFVLWHGPRNLPGGLHMTGGGVDLLLLGVVRGHWDYKTRRAELDFFGDERETVNMGMEIVTPAQEIVALLNREDQVKRRGAINREEQRRAAL